MFGMLSVLAELGVEDPRAPEDADAETTPAPKLTSAAPGSCLSPPRRIFAGETWFNVEPVSSSTDTSPAFWRILNVVLAGVTAPSSTRDG